ncbi:hypothetical protein ACPF04_12415, partial [Campylobacter sp. MOP51]|uniref:hypothetical protein n=1 Tax=Campylobacter canis TaxID=3378588 RepID=UPI003C343A80
IKEEANTTTEIKEEIKPEIQPKTEQKAEKEEASNANLANEANTTNLNIESKIEAGSNEYSTANVDEFTITPKSKVWVG